MILFGQIIKIFALLKGKKYPVHMVYNDKSIYNIISLKHVFILIRVLSFDSNVCSSLLLQPKKNAKVTKMLILCLSTTFRAFQICI